MPRTLIVTADDFGLDTAVNEAVERAHREGVLTCASLMIAGPAAADAVARARRLPRLGVGLHLALVGAPPCLPPASLPDLVDARGRLPRQGLRAGLDFFLRPRVRRQLAREMTAQFEAFTATGLTLDHVNAHKHMHVHPTVSRLLMAIGRAHGMNAVRVPAEPLAVLARVEAGTRPDFDARVMAPWAGMLRRRVRRAGLLTTEHAFGIRWTGAMHETRVLGLLANLPQGSNELYFHPAAGDGGDLAALLSPAVRSRIAELAVALTTFQGLGRGGSASTAQSTAAG